MNISEKVREKDILFINDDSNKNNIDYNKKNYKKVQYHLHEKKRHWVSKKNDLLFVIFLIKKRYFSNHC